MKSESINESIVKTSNGDAAMPRKMSRSSSPVLAFFNSVPQKRGFQCTTAARDLVVSHEGLSFPGLGGGGQIVLMLRVRYQ
eukprot:s105_g26.t1